VISTIMLNYIAIYTASWLFGDGGPLQNSTQPTVPISNPVASSAQLPVIWGTKGFQGLDIGFLIAIAALVVFWALINRTTLGFEVRAVGFNPEAAAYGGINVKKNIIRAMAISGAFAGLAGALDMLGYLYQYGQLDVAVSQIGFTGIAVALLGRNTAVGVFLASLLFGGLFYGTTQGLSSNVIQPELATNLTYIIQGLVVLFIGADILILYLWNSRKRLRPRRPPAQSPAEATTA
jgi:simple sugar transport system permease protein